MKTLFVSSQLVFSDTRYGGARRLYYYAKALEERHELKVICIDGNGEAGAMLPKHREEFSHFLQLPLEMPAGRRFRFQSPIDLRKSLGRRRREILEFLGGTEFDAVLLAFPFALSFIDFLAGRNLRNVTYLEDDLYLVGLRAEIAGLPARWRRWYRHLTLYRPSVAYYRRSFRRIAKFIAVSDEEADIMTRFIPRERIRILGNGFDLTRYPFLPVDPALSFGFIGNYRHRPNLDSLVYILDALLPEMKRNWKAFRLVLAGQDLPEALMAAHREHSWVEFMKDIPEAVDFYRRIAIFINPIVSGRGMRSKLVEAAAFGRPIVSTTLGAEGTFGMKISIVDDPAAIVRRCGELARDPERYAEEARHNREAVERDYNIESVLPRLETVLSEESSSGSRPSVRSATLSVFESALQGIRQWKRLRPW